MAIAKTPHHRKIHKKPKNIMGFNLPVIFTAGPPDTIEVGGTVHNTGSVTVTVLLNPVRVGGTELPPQQVTARLGNWSAKFTASAGFASGPYMIEAVAPAEGSTCTVFEVP
jgi:hypothetical protein